MGTYDNIEAVRDPTKYSHYAPYFGVGKTAVLSIELQEQNFDNPFYSTKSADLTTNPVEQSREGAAILVRLDAGRGK